MLQRFRYLYSLLLTCAMVFVVKSVNAQSLLQKKISIDIQRQSLKNVLGNLSKKGDFYFSYNSNLLPQDSIVSFKGYQLKVLEILHQILGDGFVFQEKGQYVIIQKVVPDGKPIVLSGTVINNQTGEKISNASVYVPRQFATTLTDSEGFFRLHIKNRFPQIQLGVRKSNYQDMVLQYPPGSHQNMNVALTPIRTVELPPIDVTPSWIDNNWMSRLLLSSKQRIRDINFSRFFVKQPFQYSIWPGLGTHGKMSAQVVNKFSMNILGGYSLGANGLEMGGLFNMDKENAQYFQTAGLFNLVGGTMTGFQLAGLHNKVEGSVAGVQIAGIINRTSNVKGAQFSGLININKNRMNGLQIAGLVNKTRRLDGLQLGMINISDTASGYSLGLVNIVKKNPYYKLALSTNELKEVNLSFKSGNRKLYNIFSLGILPYQYEDVLLIGYGLGRETRLSKSWHLRTELTEQVFMNGYHKDNPIMVRLQSSFHFSLNKKIAVFAGPAFSLYFPGSSIPKSSDKDFVLPNHYYDFSPKLKAWWGFHAGVSLF